MVDTTADGDDAADCEDDDCTLREAINEANEGSPDLDTITFASSVTGEIQLDFAAEMQIDQLLTIQGPGADVLEIDALTESRIFDIDVTDDLGDANDPVSISGLTLTRGFDGDNGGAIFSDNTHLTLTGTVITDSYAASNGGGAYTNNGNLTIAGSIFDGNRTDDFNGGAVALRNTAGEDEVEVVVSGSEFTNNFADGRAGALYLASPDGDAVIENSTVSGNDAEGPGGGIYLYAGENNEVSTIRNSTISDNESGENGGGAYFVDMHGLVIENSTISGNRAADNGGGVHLDYLYDDSEQTIQNSTVVDNAAGTDYGGGGVYLYDDSDNDIDNGPVAISSTIVANNTADFGPDLGEGEFAEGFEVGFSLIESTTTEARQITESPAGSNIFGLDPQLAVLAANGGPTQTHRPAPTSPAIDKGIANGLPTDQRGAPRTFDAVIAANAPGGDGTDIGSVELQPGEGGLPGNVQCQGQTVPEFNGTEANDTLTGTQGPDLLRGLGGADTANGAGGNDCVNGDQGKDKLRGAGGRDRVKGGAGKDRASGGGGKDKLSGQGGKDALKGGGGKDRLKGGPGKDKLSGGGGKDRLICGGGKDKVTAQEKDKVSASCEKVVERG